MFSIEYCQAICMIQFQFSLIHLNSVYALDRNLALVFLIELKVPLLFDSQVILIDSFYQCCYKLTCLHLMSAYL